MASDVCLADLRRVPTKTANDLDSKIVRVNLSMAVSDYRRHKLARGSILRTLLPSSKTQRSKGEDCCRTKYHELLLASSILVLAEGREQRWRDKC